MKVVTYCRVSTREQGRSGLGLEAQADHLRTYCRSHKYKIVHEYTEVASGGGADLSTRPVLTEAIQQGHTVIVAKLDRLSRSVKLIEDLMAEEVNFEVAEIGPGASRMELQLRAVFAEEERAKISERTKAALAAKRARGESLGNTSNLARSAHRGHETRRQAAAQAAEAHRPMFAMLAELSHSAAAKKLNEVGHRTTSGRGQWSPSMVKRVRERLTG
ncbi:MAG: recombinase family protein [Pseudomonadota bacterium]